MSTPTPDQGLILPTSSDLMAIDTILDTYNDGVESRLVKRYESAVDRGVRNPTPVKGEISYLTDTDVHERYDGADWRNMRGGVDHFMLPGETGTVNLSFTSQTTFFQQVFFATPFVVAPVVFTNISIAAGSTSFWTSRAYNIATDSFYVFVQQMENTAGTWSSVPIDWVAIGRQ